VTPPHPLLEAWAWDAAADLLQPVRTGGTPQADPAGVSSAEALSTASLLEEIEHCHRALEDPVADAPACFEQLAALALELDLRAAADPAARELLRRAADRLRRSLVGDTVTYVVNRNLNFTNHCRQHCSFCAFRRDPGEEGAFWHDNVTLLERAREARRAGATELCLQGGLNPAARLEGSQLAYAVRLLRDLHQAVPGIHLHAFSPEELLFLASQDGVPLERVLEALQAAGLGSIPGTAAEVLSEPVRRILCPEKLSAREWVAVILQVHRRGLASTSTLMAGHLETPADRIAHLLTLVALQRHARQRGWAGLSEFVLLPFIGAAAPEPLRRRVGRDQPDLPAMLRLTALARIVLGPWIPHHQPSWVKLTLAGAAEALDWGCDDLGGTLMEEHITTMAGARGGTSQTAADLQAAAAQRGRPARQRTTLYGSVPAPAACA
jgi:FO synthase subunit 2